MILHISCAWSASTTLLHHLHMHPLDWKLGQSHLQNNQRYFSEKSLRLQILCFSRAEQSMWKLKLGRYFTCKLVVGVVSWQWNANITTAKISSEGLTKKIRTLENFLLYGIKLYWNTYLYLADRSFPVGWRTAVGTVTLVIIWGDESITRAC